MHIETDAETRNSKKMELNRVHYIIPFPFISLRFRTPPFDTGVSGSLSNHLGNHLAVYIRQASLAAVVVVGEALVIEAEEAEGGGVEVVDG